MSNDLDELNKKLLKARGEDPDTLAKKKNEDKEAESRQGIQAGIELVGAIFIPTAMGYGLDQWLETTPAFMLILFFLGICTGFYNVYRINQNMGTAVGVKTSQKDEENGLHQGEKEAKKPIESEE
ncbi:MAG: AtpZ/AtpI family protein [Alphaproteobacteria bacterium]